MAHSRSAIGSERGFSFIEAAVVMVIVGILAVLGVVYSHDRKAPAVEGALNELGGFLANARNTARSTGTQVVLTPSGSGRDFSMSYALAGGPSEAYNHASQTAVNNYCVVVTDASTEPASSAIANLRSALLNTKVDTISNNLFTTGMWTNNLCSSGLTFKTNGAVIAEGFVAVASIETNANAPVGIILVTSSGNMLRYYRSGNTAVWVRK